MATFKGANAEQKLQGAAWERHQDSMPSLEVPAASTKPAEEWSDLQHWEKKYQSKNSLGQHPICGLQKGAESSFSIYKAQASYQSSLQQLDERQMTLIKRYGAPQNVAGTTSATGGKLSDPALPLIHKYAQNFRKICIDNPVLQRSSEAKTHKRA